MRFEQLKCLAEVARTGSISGAAQQLYLTQQAASLNIKQLEQELGADLLIRTKTGVAFTDSSKAVVSFAQEVLAAKDDLTKTIRQLQGECEQEEFRIKICSISSVTNIVLPTVLAELNAQQKNISIRMVLTDSLEALFAQVQSREYDLGLLSFNENVLLEKFTVLAEQYQLEILARDEMVAVMDKRFYKGEQEQLSLTEYASHLKTIYNIIPIEEMRSSAWDTNVVCSNDAKFHREMLEKTGAIVMMPYLAYQYFFNSKKYVALPLENSSTTMLHAAFYRKDADEQLRQFVDMLRREMYIK